MDISKLMVGATSRNIYGISRGLIIAGFGFLGTGLAILFSGEHWGSYVDFEQVFKEEKEELENLEESDDNVD